MTTQTPKKSPRVGLVVAGVITAVLAFGLATAGGLALWADDQKDEAGFVATDGHGFSSNGAYALVSENMDVDLDGASRLVDHDQFGKVRLEVERDGDKPVFVGIARTGDVRRYLRDVAHRTVTDVEYSPFHAEYDGQAGDRRPAPPANKSFWVESASGRGTQTVRWDVEDGDWSIVVMNADGSAGVDADIAVGAKLPWLDDLGWSLLGGGGVTLAGAAALLFAGLRRPRGPRPSATVAPAAA